MKLTSSSETQDGVVFNEESELYEVYVCGVLRGLTVEESDAQSIYREVKK